MSDDRTDRIVAAAEALSVAHTRMASAIDARLTWTDEAAALEEFTDAKWEVQNATRVLLKAVRT